MHNVHVVSISGVKTAIYEIFVLMKLVIHED